MANYALVAVAMFNGVSLGAQPLVSRYYGQGDQRSVKQILKLGRMTALVLAVVLIGVVYGFTGELTQIFNSENSKQLAEYAHTGLRLYFIGFLFAGFNIVGTGFLSATEKAKEAFITSVLRGFVGIPVCSVLLSALLGLNGVWLAFPASELITAAVMIFMLRKTKQ